MGAEYRAVSEKLIRDSFQTIYRWDQRVMKPDGVQIIAPQTVELARMCRSIAQLKECYLLEDSELDWEHIQMYREKWHPDKVPFYVVKYAQLPVVRTCLDFLIEVVRPVKLVPTTISLTHSAVMVQLNHNAVPLLKKEVVEYITAIEGYPRPVGFRGVDDIELVACDLLVPKE